MTNKLSARGISPQPEGAKQQEKPRKGMSWFTLSQAYALTQKFNAKEGKPALTALDYDAVAAKGVLAEGITKAVNGVIPPRLSITEASKSQLHEAICPETGHGIRRQERKQDGSA